MSKSTAQTYWTDTALGQTECGPLSPNPGTVRKHRSPSRAPRGEPNTKSRTVSPRRGQASHQTAPVQRMTPPVLERRDAMQTVAVP